MLRFARLPSDIVLRGARLAALAAVAVLAPALGAVAQAGGGAPCDGCIVGPAPCNGAIEGQFPAGECALPDGSRVDLYRLDLAAPARVRLRLASAEFDTFLLFQDAQCKELAANDDCLGTDSCLTFDAAAGVYTIGVNSFEAGQEGAFRLEVECEIGFDPCRACERGALRCDQRVEGALPTPGCDTVEGTPVDYWSFEAPRPGRYQVALVSESFDTILTLLDASCARIAGNDDCLGSNSCLTVDLDTGVYRIGVGAFTSEEAGEYHLEATCPDARPCAECSAGEIACGAVGDGSLGPLDCRLLGGEPIEYWSLTLDEELPLDLTLRAVEGALDPVLYLYDDAGELIAVNDDCRDVDLDACISRVLPPGRYCIGASGFLPEGEGAYALGVRCAPLSPLQAAGDCNQDGGVDISDGICILGHLFDGRPSILPCGKGPDGAAGNLALLDATGDGELDLSDAVHVFSYLFIGRPSAHLSRGCIVIPDCPGACGG